MSKRLDDRRSENSRQTTLKVSINPGLCCIRDGDALLLQDDDRLVEVGLSHAADIVEAVVAGCDTHEAIVARLASQPVASSPLLIHAAIRLLIGNGVLTEATPANAPYGGPLALETMRMPDPGEASQKAPSGHASVGLVLDLRSRRSKETVACLGGLHIRKTDTAIRRAEGLSRDALLLVVVDDETDPNLEPINKAALRHGYSWLIARPCGTRALLGPLMVPGATACWTCWRERRKAVRERNRTSKMRVLNECAAAGPPLSPAGERWLWTCLDTMLSAAPADLSGCRLAGAAFEIDVSGLTMSRHEVVKRRTCPHCGDDSDLGRRDVIEGETNLDAHPSEAPREDDCMQMLENAVNDFSGVVSHLKETPSPIRGFSVYSVRFHPGSESGLAGQASLSTLAYGKGLRDEAARAGAIAEGIERWACTVWRHRSFISAPERELGPRCIPASRLEPFSQKQFADRHNLRLLHPCADVPDPPPKPNCPILWDVAWSVRDRCWKHVPAATIHFGFEDPDGGRFGCPSSNGVAAGWTTEEARVRAVFELVERDAVGLWWANRLRLRPLPEGEPMTPASMAMAGLLKSQLPGTGKLLLGDLTTDLGVPVAGAFWRDADNADGWVPMGFGAGATRAIACERAVSELLQGLAWPTPVDFCRTYEEMNGSKLVCDRQFECDWEAPRAPLDAGLADAQSPIEQLDAVCRILLQRNIDALFVCLDHPDVPLRVSRALGPGLAHFWPRHGCARLTTVPAMMGWRPDEAASFNPLPVPV